MNQQRLEDPLAQKILASEVPEDSLVTIDAKGKSFVFDVEATDKARA